MSFERGRLLKGQVDILSCMSWSHWKTEGVAFRMCNNCIKLLLVIALARHFAWLKDLGSLNKV